MVEEDYIRIVYKCYKDLRISKKEIPSVEDVHPKAVFLRSVLIAKHAEEVYEDLGDTKNALRLRLTKIASYEDARMLDIELDVEIEETESILEMLKVTFLDTRRYIKGIAQTSLITGW